jgi:ribosomal-protein-alanine N-acetyltransferase
MALLDWISPESSLRIEGDGVVLRPPRPADYLEWRELRAASRTFLQPWEPTWPADDLSRAAFRRRLAAYQRDRDLGVAYPFLITRPGDGALTLAALRALSGFAFRTLALHRLEAACIPQNQASRTLLAKAGFAEEGYAKAYLKINGEWRDHVLFGLTTPHQPFEADEGVLV